MTTSFTSASSKNSFVMIRLDYQTVPYVSLQFLFHSNISYSDRISLIESFKNELKDFNQGVSQIASQGLNNSLVVSPNLNPTNRNSNANTSLLLTPTSSIYTTQQSAAAAFSYHKQSNASVISNISFDDTQQPHSKDLASEQRSKGDTK